LEIRARSLALQIQWIVVDINNIFLREHQTHANAMPTCNALNFVQKKSLRGLPDVLKKAFLKLENASLTLIQGRNWYIE
jgi:hypothetical protein